MLAGVHEATPNYTCAYTTADVHETISHAEVKRWLVRLDPDGSGYIDTSEFVDAMLRYITRNTMEAMEGEAAYPPATYVSPAELTGGVAEGAAEAEVDALTQPFVAVDQDGGEGEEEEEEEEAEEAEEEDAEVPEDLLALSWREQQRHIKRRAAKLMGAGALGFLLFADPMVDVLANVGSRVRPAPSHPTPPSPPGPPRLPPHVLEAPTLCNPRCNQPCAIHAATLCLPGLGAALLRSLPTGTPRIQRGRVHRRLQLRCQEEPENHHGLARGARR